MLDRVGQEKFIKILEYTVSTICYKIKEEKINKTGLSIEVTIDIFLKIFKEQAEKIGF